MVRWRAVLGLLLLFLVTGCGGGGSGGGTFTSDQGPSAPRVATGNVSFQFVRAQEAVHASATRLRFLFFDGAEGQGTLLKEEFRPFASSVTITSIPVTVRSVRVVALDAEGTSLSTTIIALTVREGETVTVSLSQLSEIVITRLRLQPEEAELRVGGVRQFSVLAETSDGGSRVPSDVVWSATGVVSVDANGRVTGQSLGAGQVTARVGTLTASANVTVVPNSQEPPSRQLTEFSLNSSMLTLEVGGTASLQALGTFSDDSTELLTNAGHGLTYQSSDDAVVTVDDAGSVQAVGEGEAQLTATVGALTQQVAVTVSASESPSIVLDPREGLVLRFYQGDPATLINPYIVVTAPEESLEDGRLVVEGPLYNTILLSEITAPVSPNIGTVTGSGTSKLEVQLSPDVTPGMVQQFLRGVTVRLEGPQDHEFLQITLETEDGTEVVTYSSVEFKSNTPLELTVDPTAPLSATNFHVPQLAFDHIGDWGGDNSRVTLAAWDFTQSPTTRGAAVYRRYPDHWTIAGANEGKPIGTAPVTWGAETILGSLEMTKVSSLRLDGLTFKASATGVSGYMSLWNGPQDALTIANCRFVRETLGYSGGEVGSKSVVLLDSRFENMGHGIDLYRRYNLEVRRCLFSQCSTGLSLGESLEPEPGTVVVRDNAFSDVTTLLSASGNSTWTSDIENNDFSATGEVVLTSDSTQSLDLSNNWWGAVGGPVAGRLRSEASGQSIIVLPALDSDPVP